MTFLVTYNSEDGYKVTTISGSSLDLALCDFKGSDEDIISIVREY